MGAFEGVPTETLRAALAFLNHQNPDIRAAYLLGTEMGRHHAEEAMEPLIQRAVKKSLSEQLGAPPWEINPIPGYDRPITETERREMFPPLREAA